MQKQTDPTKNDLPAPGQILDALEQILATEKFQAAPQMSAFLRYVVEQAASGNESRIKAYTVAIDALGKPDTFDPQNDPVVRVLAGRLRSSLSAYYESHPSTELMITMKPGSYVPGFIIRKTSDSVVSITDNLPPNKSYTDHHNVTLEQEHAGNETAPDVGTTRQAAIPASDNCAANTAVIDTTGSQLAGAQVAAQTNKSDQTDMALTPKNLSGSFLIGLFQSPVTALCVGLVAVGSLVIHDASTDHGVNLNRQAANPVLSASTQNAPVRVRPDVPAIFFNTSEPSNSLEEQLNTMISGVLSESDQFEVYRLQDPDAMQHTWPEDYIVSLNVLPMSEETRVSVQLINAQSGHISHSETLALSATADKGLSRGELTRIMDVAHHLISDDGPLINDDSSSTVTDSASSN